MDRITLGMADLTTLAEPLVGTTQAFDDARARMAELDGDPAFDEAASTLDRAEFLVQTAVPRYRVELAERPVWHLVLGLDRGWGTAALASFLLLYNCSDQTFGLLGTD